MKITPDMAIIFDMDGVLVDSEPLSDRHLQEFLKELKVNNTERLKTNLRGLNIKAFLNVLKDDLGLNFDYETMKARYRKSYINYLKKLPTLPEIPGVAAFVKYLYERNYTLAIGSSAGPLRIDLLLNHLQLKKYFPYIISGDDITHSKPHPETFSLVAERVGISPKQCVVIEDSTNGVKAAKAAGMKCIAYAGSLHNTDDLSEADLIIKDFSWLEQTFDTVLKTL